MAKREEDGDSIAEAIIFGIILILVFPKLLPIIAILLL